MAVQWAGSAPWIDLDGYLITQVITERNVNQKVSLLFIHHLIQISNESSEVDFDVIQHTKLLGAVLSSAFFPNLVKVWTNRLDMDIINTILY